MTYVYLLIVLNVLGMTRRVNRQHVFLNIFMGYNLSGVNLAASRYGPAVSKPSMPHLSKVGPLGLAKASGLLHQSHSYQVQRICSNSTHFSQPLKYSNVNL